MGLENIFVKGQILKILGFETACDLSHSFLPFFFFFLQYFENIKPLAYRLYKNSLWAIFGPWAIVLRILFKNMPEYIASVKMN